MTKGRTWKGVSEPLSAEVKRCLLELGANADHDLKGGSEVWRLRLEGSVFTFYKSGSLFCSGGASEKIDPIYTTISKLLGQELETPEKEILFGLDETGKGEVLGHSVLCLVKLHRDILLKVDSVVSTADTKKRKAFAYWDSLFRELDSFVGRGMSYEIETIPPWDVDKFNVNKILDVVYQRLLARNLRGDDPSSCRIILDDYGMGRNLAGYFATLSKAGAEVRVESKADERYVEVRTAAVISKWRQQLNLTKINEKFSLPETPVGSGNAGDPATLKWLRGWKKTGEKWPWFVKASFSTVREIDGLPTGIRKSEPPIRHELLSQDSRNLFKEGQLSTSSLRIVCPSCGTNMSAVKLTPDPDMGLVGRCISCNEIVRDLSTTLRYYCGVIVPDSNVIISGYLSKDLDRKGFFDGYTILFHPIVRRETDTPGGKKELERLGDFDAMGRIAFRAITDGIDVEKPDRDAALIERAKDIDAIIMTTDKGMYGNATARQVFCLSFRT